MPEAWQLVQVEERFEEWVQLERPADWRRVLVLNWLLARIDNPYEGLRGEEGFDNLWFGVVSKSLDEDGTVVVCSLWIDEHAHVVRCDRIATLGWPVE